MNRDGRLDLDLSRVGFYGVLLFLFWDRPLADYGLAPASLYRPAPLPWLLGFPAPEPATTALLSAAWKLSIAASLFGLLTRLSTAACFALGAYFLSLDWAFGYVHHRYHLTVVCAGILALSDCARRVSLDRLIVDRFAPPGWSWLSGVSRREAPDSRWPLLLGRACWCLVYFGAGLAKLRGSGVEYLTTDRMRYFLDIARLDYGPHATPLQERLHGLVAASPVLHRTGGFAAMCLELAAPAALFSTRLRLPLVAAMAALHVAAYFVLFIRFKEIAPAYALWVPWTRLWDAARASRPRG